MFWALVDGDEQYSQFLYILLRCMKSNTVEMVWFVQHYSVKGKVIWGVDREDGKTGVGPSSINPMKAS